MFRNFRNARYIAILVFVYSYKVHRLVCAGLLSVLVVLKYLALRRFLCVTNFENISRRVMPGVTNLKTLSVDFLFCFVCFLMQMQTVDA